MTPQLLRRAPFKRVKRVAREAALDIVIIYTSYVLATLARSVTTDLQIEAQLWFFASATLLTVILLYVFGAYRRLWARTSGHGIVVLINAVGLAYVIATLVDLFIVPRPAPLSVIAIANIMAFVGVVGVRYRSRVISGLSWRWDAVWNQKFPTSQTRVMIVGAGEAGQALAWRLKYRSPGKHYSVVCFVDDDPQKQGMLVEGTPVAGTRNDIEALVARHTIDVIVIAINNISGQDFRHILSLCEKTKARIKVVPDLFAMIDGTLGPEILRDVQPEDYLGRKSITRHEAVDLRPVTGKRVLITGAAGSIGSELSRQMARYEPTCLILLDNNESGLHDLHIELTTQHRDVKIVPILADITQDEPSRTVFETYRPEVVFHAAAYKHVPLLEMFPEAAIKTNIGGTKRIAELAQEYEAERFVLISSDKAVNPSNVMGATKRVCELLLHALAQKEGKTLFASVRFGNVLGSRGSVVPTFNRQIDSGGPVTVTDPNMTRYFMTIPEAVNLVIHAACLTTGDDTFFLQMGEVIRIVDLAERMIRMRGLRPYIDIGIEFVGVRPGEKLHEELYSEDEELHSTVHPHITLLKPITPLAVDEFNAGVERLLSSTPQDRVAVLREIQQIIQMQPTIDQAVTG